MKITDAAVCPYPDGDSSVRRLALEAEALGFDSFVAADTPSATFGGVEVRRGLFIQNAGMKDVISQVKRVNDSGAVVSVRAGDAGFNRGVVGLRGVHILRGVHAADKNAFDHVTAKMAADNCVAVDIDLSCLILARGIARQKAIQRYRDVMVLEQRFEFPLTLSTYARSVLDLRAVREVSGLCTLFGMDLPDVEKALAGVGAVTAPPEPAVKVV
ncbi:RNase P subunit p30 family protein [Methanoregula formicica]|uniref:Ribonuclease P protein component 3 n=1 Tax=Methanoregula formicica (strain DSM 22288 / NBRC 105244 / SMSP) TaxID=593750 RepID=L0HGM0_METFS|nr:RNase P subunit p30 family protein [Methanoregula formicica]AGB02204.1 RNase P/RNase MRP subunit p30 [Methanoregula formicica SMSP]